MISEKDIENDFLKALKKEDKNNKPISDFLAFMELGRLVLKVLVNIRTNTLLPEEEKKRLFEEQKQKRERPAPTPRP